MSEKELKLSRKYVNVDNQITTSASHNFSSMSLKLITYALYKISFRYDKLNIIDKYKDVDLLNRRNWNGEMFEDFSCSFSTKEFCNDLGLSDGGNQRLLIESAITKASEESIMLETENVTRWFPWFVEVSYYHPKSSEIGNGSIESSDNNITISFNPVVLYIALRNSKKYTNIDLLIIGKLKSVYSIKWYEIIKSRFNMIGKYGNPHNVWKTNPMSIEEIKILFDIEKDAYCNRNDNFLKKIVVNPVKELNESGIDFTITIEVKRGYRNRIETVSLVCTNMGKRSKIKTDDTTDVRKYKIQRNELESTVVKYKEKYPEQWKEFENEVRENHRNDMFFADVLVNASVVEMFQKSGIN